MKILSVFTLLFLFILLGNYSLSAQETARKNCPQIRINVDGRNDGKKPVIYEAIIEGIDPNAELKYVWVVTSARIVKGQGTIKIKIKKLAIGAVYTATVEILGLPTGCSNSYSATPPIS